MNLKHFAPRMILALLTLSIGLKMTAGTTPITITFPDTDQIFRESDEFAGMEAGKAWDMSDLHDVTWFSGFVPPLNHPTDGIWTGLYCRADAPAYFWPLFRGVISDPGYYQYFTWHNPGTPYGPFNPIDADRFTRLSVRHALPAARRSAFTVNWFRTLLDATEVNYLAFADGDYARAGGPPVWMPNPDGFRIYDIDLTGADFNADRIPGFSGFGSPSTSDNWGGTMYGLYIVPSLDARKDTAYALDWLRLYRSEPETRIALTWTNDPLHPEVNRVSLQLFVATNNVDDPGDLYLSGIENNGAMTFHTGALPPGEYYLYLKAVLDTGDGFSELGRSAYSPSILINARPTFEFTAPSFTSGVEYATADRGNPWNMSGPEDIDLSRIFDISGGGFTNNRLTATLSGSDPQIALDVPAPIDTARYRYLTFRMFYDTSPFPLSDFPDCDQRAWDLGTVARWVWAKSDFGLDGSYTKDILLQEGWYDYTVDLWDRELLETRGEFGTAQAGWREISQANFLILHPLEAELPVTFILDYVKLNAPNAAVNHGYDVRWIAGDADGDQLDITLQYGTGADADFTALGTIAVLTNQPAGAGNVNWNTANVPAGHYTLRAIVSDGLNTLERDSRLTVTLGDPAPPPPVLPTLSIRGNDIAGRLVTDTNTTVNLTVALDPGGYAGELADWWVIAWDRDHHAWYYLDDAMTWTPFNGGDLSLCRPAHAGGLFTLAATPIPPPLRLQPGTYFFYFAVDPMDGVLNYPGPMIVHDALEIVVE